MSNTTNIKCCNQNCRQGRDCPLRIGATDKSHSTTATVRPYHHPTCEGMQLQHWEVVISTHKHDVIEIHNTAKAAQKRAEIINKGGAA